MKRDTRIRLSSAGSLTSAGTVAATIFCCLPFATGLLGAGVAAFGARFAPLQPYLACASLAFLGYAFYQAYRPSATACVGDHCDVPSALCYRRLALWLIALAVVGMLAAPWWANWVIYWTL